MAPKHDDSDQPREVDDVRARIEKLRQKAASLSGGSMAASVSPDTPPEVEEQFWKQVLAFEDAPQVEPLTLLTRSGLNVKSPDEVDDDHLNATLWDVIRGLAEIGIYLHSTDHLSDRELYVRLWTDVLRDPMELDPEESDACWHVDLVSGGSEEDIHLYLKHYADEEERRRWAKEWPDDPLPPHVAPPFDRDRHLPHGPV